MVGLFFVPIFALNAIKVLLLRFAKHFLSPQNSLFSSFFLLSRSTYLDKMKMRA